MSYPSWYAVEELDESVDDTKSFLLPFDKGVWLRVALIVLLTGGFISGFPGTGTGDIGEPGNIEDNTTAELFEGEKLTLDNSENLSTALGFAVLGILAGIASLMSYLSSLFELIFYRAVNLKDPSILNGISDQWLNGLKYLVFRTVVFGVFIATIAFPILFAAFESLIGVLISLAAIIPVWIALIVTIFTVNNYSIPKIVTTDEGFINSVRSGFGAFRSEWKQATIFFLVGIVVNIFTGIISGMVNLLTLIFFGIPVGVVSYFVYTMNPVLAIIPVLVLILGLFTVSLAIAVPLQTYKRQWVLNTFNHFAE